MKTKKMELVMQPPGSAWCLACCVAMICDHTLDQVITECHYQLKEVEPPHPLEGLPYLPIQRAVKYLAQYGYGYGNPAVWPEGLRLRNDWTGDVLMKVNETPAMVTVKSRIYQGGLHMVVYCPDRGAFLDPQQLMRQSILDYDIVEWACTPKLPKA